MERWSRHVALIGLSGAGKSTTGVLLAQGLSLPFVDTDRETERSAGMPVHEIFTRLGEPKFRRMEAVEVRRALEGQPAVISLGGGAVLDPVSRCLIWQRALVVWLRASPEELAARLSDARPEVRPLLGTGDRAARLAELLVEREPVYVAAHLSIDTAGCTPEDVAVRLQSTLNASLTARSAE